MFNNLITQTTDSFGVGDVIALKGEHFKGEPASEDSNTPPPGVFLIDTVDGVETQAETYLKNTDKNYEFIVPPKASGTYSNAIKIEVRTVYTPHGTLRTGTYPHTVDGSKQSEKGGAIRCERKGEKKK
ncbi:MAG: hypothetical protein DRR19_21875 [Candidatus Parabeggiatoa sp. nov. 1]|nr:MAG: hypothetical protein DRR19_21875 [Gammaproteobacteria bacterium]